ncbi:MAG: 2Fe-2S iron-sulfur cluster binding domain-containing protein, partial [Actinobacteria bacterium]|nr:2Fe-2S iron-sulfur cluster binding domain-containing protein [Actinomycetota bacterium]
MEANTKHGQSGKSDVIDSNINLFIDSKPVIAGSSDTLLQAARNAGIHIPALCYHDKVKPHGACRLCIVEIVKNGKSRIVASCAYPAEDGLQVFTESPKINEIRKHLVELYMALFPYNEEIKAL